MGRYTAGWITVPGKGRRWRTSEGEYMMQRPAGDALMGALQGAWSGADKALGGWLPGGGTPNVLTRGYDRPTGQLRQRIEGMGFDPDKVRVANLEAKRPIENRIAYEAGKMGLTPWGAQEFGGNIPLRGPVIGVYGNRVSDKVLKHEMAHATDPRKTVSAGRMLQGASAAVGNPSALRALSGLALYGDARAEDYAESISTVHPSGNPKAYGDSLRKEGRQELVEAGLGTIGLTPPVRRVVGNAARAVGGVALNTASAAVQPAEQWLFNQQSARMDKNQELDPTLLNADRMLSKYRMAIEDQRQVLESMGQ